MTPPIANFRLLICAALVALPLLASVSGCAPPPPAATAPLELDPGFTNYCRNNPDAQCQLPKPS